MTNKGNNTRYVAGNACFWLVAVLFMFGSSQVSAEDKFYMGLEAGFSKSGDLDISHSFVNHPTRCDSLLYAPGATPPGDAECTADQTSIIGLKYYL